MYFLATVLAILAVVPAFELATATRGWRVWGSLGLTGAATLMFLPSHWLGGLNLFTLNTPYWSLFFELVVNAVYAGAAKVLNNSKLIIAMTLALFAAIAIGLKMDTGLSGGWGWSWLHLLMGSARSIFGIGAGILLYRKQHRLAHVFHIQASSHARWGIAIPVLTTALMVTPSIGDLDISIDIFACAVLFPICVLFATRVDWENRWFLLICSALGSISYPLYVLHIPVSSLFKLLAPTWIESYASISGPVVLAILLILSYAAEKGYEIPARRWLSRRVLFKNDASAGK